MWKYVGRRLGSALISMFFILVIGFLIVQLQPYDPAQAYLARLSAQGETVDEQALQRQYGLDEPGTVR